MWSIENTFHNTLTGQRERGSNAIQGEIAGKTFDTARAAQAAAQSLQKHVRRHPEDHHPDRYYDHTVEFRARLQQDRGESINECQAK